ncbi:MAG: WYL domain-containing protein [Sneathiella sp.]
MKKQSTHHRFERLEILIARLKSDEPLIVRHLASELGVSVRTVTRDIQILREQGLPVEADRGRGGGVRLHWSWGLGQLKLSYSEAIDLLVSLAVVEQMNSPILMANLKSVRHKLMASFSKEMKSRIGSLNRRIRIGQTASPFVLSSYEKSISSATERLHQAFVLQRYLSIIYKAENGDLTIRLIEPQYLLLNYPVWYILAWDQLRGDIRTFRCDRIQGAEIEEEVFDLRPFDAFSNALEGVVAIEP